MWKKLWSIKTPAKMKILLWRIVHDCLPTRVLLKGRHICTSNMCFFCGQDETLEHAIFMCHHASLVWHLIKRCFGLKLKFQYFISMKHRLFDFLAAASEKEATILMVTLQHIWEARNSATNREIEKHPQMIAEKVKAYVEMILLHIFKPSTYIGVSLITLFQNGLHRRMDG